MVTMSQKSSLLQPAKSVSQVLIPDKANDPIVKAGGLSPVQMEVGKAK
jgi:hypothetical protein